MPMPPLLMIHGMWSRPSAFAQLRAELEAAGLRSAAITLPHHDVPPGNPAPAPLGSLKLGHYVAALEREVAELGEQPVILGHSLGGLLAQLVSVKVQPRALILLSTAPSAQTVSISLTSIRTMRRVTSRWGWWREPTLLDAGSARYGGYNGVPEAEIRPALADLTWDSGPVLAQLAVPWLDREKGSRVDYSRLAMPTLVITGLEDRIVPPATSRKTARLISATSGRVDYEEWPGVGHWLFHDAVRPRVAASISRFMASLN